MKKSWRWLAAVVMGLGACAVYCLAAFIPEGASEEYIYTAQVLAKYLFPLFITGFLFFVAGIGILKSGLPRLALISFAIGALFIYIPLYSPVYTELSWRAGAWLSISWALGFLALGIGFQSLCVKFKSGFKMWAFSFAGAVFIALGLVEGFYALTSQKSDGLRYANDSSEYILSGQAHLPGWNVDRGICGSHVRGMGRPVATAERYMYKDTTLYDAMYGFDARGRRALPDSVPNPRADLLLFGCSFTFGAGLNDEQTWAWLLARDLGPEWHLENYAKNGNSASQMLCMIENNLVEKPEAPARFALFLAIGDHLKRNDFFSNGPHYELDGRADPIHSGKPEYAWITEIPSLLNGSQLAIAFSWKATAKITKLNYEKFKKTYLAIINKASQLLKRKYDTRLFVLLWPGTEDLAPALNALGIPVIHAKKYLAAWGETSGEDYVIGFGYDGHPNARAAKELAAGLAGYFAGLLGSVP